MRAGGLGAGGGEAMRVVRWLVAVAATVAVFGGCLWLFRFASWSWMPHATSDRWAVAAAFATVTAGVVGAAGTWWASREIPRRAGPADTGGTGPGPGVPAAGERSVAAGGIASTGDGQSVTDTTARTVTQVRDVAGNVRVGGLSSAASPAESAPSAVSGSRVLPPSAPGAASGGGQIVTGSSISGDVTQIAGVAGDVQFGP